MIPYLARRTVWHPGEGDDIDVVVTIRGKVFSGADGFGYATLADAADAAKE